MKSFKGTTLQCSKVFSGVGRGQQCCVSALARSLFWIVCLLVISGAPALAQGQRCFSSPRQAVDALVLAVHNDDKEELMALFGPGSEQLISSGDEVADQRGRARFIKASEQKMTLETVSATQQTLIIGARDYPFPIPLVHHEQGWFFDAASGMEELLNRRIGRNELRTIKVMEAYTDAQREYACLARNTGVPAFAQNLASSDGTQDGLYWPVSDGEAESPFGPLIAKATARGYHVGDENGFADPFYGYYYTILTAQGESARGGAFDYIIDGKMVLGFALIAYPARYGVSGIMTFIVNQEGVIYQKDLGANTPTAASQITVFDPDSSWQAYEEPND